MLEGVCGLELQFLLIAGLEAKYTFCFFVMGVNTTFNTVEAISRRPTVMVEEDLSACITTDLP